MSRTFSTDATQPTEVAKHEFTFSGLVNCGDCGCALVAEKKKRKYVYHCTGNKGKCFEPYTREEVLDECFADLLKGLDFDDQVMDWIVLAKKKSRRNRFQRPSSYLAPHIGQSSQLVIDANHRNA